jgi:hypothetical protein
MLYLYSPTFYCIEGTISFISFLQISAVKILFLRMILKSVFTIIKLLLTVMVVILYIHYFFPQSWGFYTIEPKQPLYDIYVIHDGMADKKSLIKNNISYGMGISIKGKILFNELYGIVNKNLPWKQLIEDSLNYITTHETYT